METETAPTYYVTHGPYVPSRHLEGALLHLEQDVQHSRAIVAALTAGDITKEVGHVLFQALDDRSLPMLEQDLHVMPYQPEADGFPSATTNYKAAA